MANNNPDFEIKCVPLFTGAWCEPPTASGGGAGAIGGDGITVCTVGNVANANVDFHSIAEALAFGCYFIRVVDGATGGQVPGYIEPTGFNISGLPSPVMIYLDPGVDWTLRASVIGASSINLSSNDLTFRGSGWGSRIVVDNDAGAVPMILTDATTQLFMYDLQVDIDNLVPFFTTVLRNFYTRNCRWSSTNNSSTAPMISLAGGGRFEIHECTFNGSGIFCIAINGGVATTELIMSDCVADGLFRSSLASGFDLSVPAAAGAGQVLVDGLLFRTASGGVSGVLVTIGGGVYNNIISSSTVVGSGNQVTITFASEATLADSRIHYINTITVDRVLLDNVELNNELAAVNLVASFCNFSNVQFPGGITIFEAATFNVITGLNNKNNTSPGNLNLIGQNNVITSFWLGQLSVGAAGIANTRENVISSGNCSNILINSANNGVAPFEGNTLADIHCNSTMSVTNTNNCQFDNIRVNTSLVEVTGGAEAGNQYSNCSFGAGSTSATIAPAIYTSERLKFSNCKFGRPVGSGAGTFYNMTFSATADELQMSNCYISGTLILENDNCTISNLLMDRASFGGASLDIRGSNNVITNVEHIGGAGVLSTLDITGSFNKISNLTNTGNITISDPAAGNNIADIAESKTNFTMSTAGLSNSIANSRLGPGIITGSLTRVINCQFSSLSVGLLAADSNIKVSNCEATSLTVNGPGAIIEGCRVGGATSVAATSLSSSLGNCIFAFNPTFGAFAVDDTRVLFTGCRIPGPTGTSLNGTAPPYDAAIHPSSTGNVPIA